MAPFNAQEVWDRFQNIFPVLAIYRKGWVLVNILGERHDPEVCQEWEAMWLRHSERTASARELGEVLRWPALLITEALHLLVPVARFLWPDLPWDAAWLVPTEDDAAPLIRRAAVPVLRRTACLLYGFQLVGCSAGGVYEAMKIPGRMG